jgi:hypothetical protein
MKQRKKIEDKELGGQGNCAMGGAMGEVCRTNLKNDVCKIFNVGLYIQAIPWLLKRFLL